MTAAGLRYRHIQAEREALERMSDDVRAVTKTHELAATCYQKIDESKADPDYDETEHPFANEPHRNPNLLEVGYKCACGTVSVGTAWDPALFTEHLEAEMRKAMGGC